MKILSFDDNTWLYPDLTPDRDGSPELLLARGGHTGFQFLTDVTGSAAKLSAKLPAGITARWYQLVPVTVEFNSGPKHLVALPEEDVSDFVTRKAPFQVYDLTVPIEAETALRPVRTAFFVRLEAAADAAPGAGTAEFTVTVNGETATVSLPLTVSRAVVPPLAETDFIVNNWLTYEDICALHHVEQGSARFYELLDAYLDNLVELRSNHLQLPSGVPVCDADGRVTDFDFSFCEAIADHAIARGVPCVYGGFVARWKVWKEPEIFTNWDRDLDVTSTEAYRQFRLYFTKLWGIVTRHGWQDHWMQCLVDEPQTANAMSYRVLAGICRKFMPGVLIHDPCESPDLLGGTDIWCVKQATFDKHREDFKFLQSLGERLTVYTCGFPAYKWMNRATDLPLLAGRLPFWICAREHFEGFLHWGYNVYRGEDPYEHNCCLDEGRHLPPGDGFIVYPGENGPIPTLRAHVQLFGTEDCEILRQLPEEKVRALTEKVAPDFLNYVDDPAEFAVCRKELLLSF